MERGEHVWMLGEPGEKQRLKKRERVRGWGGRISEHGVRGRLEPWLEQAHAFFCAAGKEEDPCGYGWSIGLVAVDGRAFFSGSLYFLER